jgi:hypothetical protein
MLKPEGTTGFNAASTLTVGGVWPRKSYIRRAVVHSRAEVRRVMPPPELGQSDEADI